MFDNKTVARWICHATEITGFSGKRWAIMANFMRLYYELVKSLRQEIATFGYEALPVPLKSENEVCRMEGDAIIVVVERTIGNDSVGYDSTVYCREQDIRPVISQALQPIVIGYGEKDFALLRTFLNTPTDAQEKEHQ